MTVPAASVPADASQPATAAAPGQGSMPAGPRLPPPPDDLPRLAPRAADSHKGSYGLLVCIGGSRGMAGAIGLTAMAALRSGAGLVRVAVPEPCLATVAAFEPAYMTLPLPADAEGRVGPGAMEALRPQLDVATALACGPGLGTGADAQRLVAWLNAAASAPLVLDADGLNCLAAGEGWGQAPPHLGASGPRVLTPHPGELRRLVPELAERPVDRAAYEAAADALAARSGAVVVLKGPGSLITDGHRSTRNPSGNPGLARGGTGDILTGVIGALLAQGLPAFDAARLGTFVHGRAGDLAAAALGPVGMTASDVVRYLPAAWQSLG